MQNKPNFPDDQMNVSGTITKDYENRSNWKLGKNKANTKPLKPNLLDTQMNVSSALTKDYENQGRLRPPRNKPNQTQFQRLKTAEVVVYLCRKPRARTSKEEMPMGETLYRFKWSELTVRD
jgi:hypothetical protein